jgi:RimJ/RimL family protein N-acetyltransferase
VVLKANGVLVGDCGLTHMQVEGVLEVELGYDLRSAYWHRGLATEAATAVRDHAFEVLELPRLVSLIRQGNRASQRVAEKVGMRLVRNLVQHGAGYLLYTCSRDEDEPSVG